MIGRIPILSFYTVQPSTLYHTLYTILIPKHVYIPGTIYHILYTLYHILCTIYYILYTIYYILYILYTIYSIYYIFYILYTIYYIFYILYTIYYILYTIYYIRYTIYVVPWAGEHRPRSRGLRGWLSEAGCLYFSGHLCRLSWRLLLTGPRETTST